MGWFGRLKLIWHTEMYDALDALEDPKKGMDYSLVRLEEHLAQAQQSLVDITTAQHLLGNRRGQAAAAAVHAEDQARAALASGREDLATRALGRRQTALAREADLEAAAANLAGQADALRVTLAALQTHVELLRSKKEELKAIYDSAQAQLKVREALTGLSDDLNDVGHTMQRAEERVRRVQMRAGAIDYLAATGALVNTLELGGDDIDHELGQLRISAAVESDLARLKGEAAPQRLTDGWDHVPAGMG